MTQTSFDFPQPITHDERRGLAALEICYGLLINLCKELGIDDATNVRFGQHAFSLPGSNATIGGILDQADAVLGDAKARG